jgi:uncharacterized RDD family membrane protein YckC
MVTGFDIWGHDPALRRHWRGRIAAFLVDAAIAFVPTSIVLYLLGIDDIALIGLLNTVVFYLVSSVPESLTGATLGKRIFGFKVHPTKGESLSGRVCVRNITRAFWFVLPPIDFVLGMATRGDPRERMMDRVAGTRVVHAGETERHENAIRAATEEAERELRSGTEDACQKCGGKLLRLPDEKLQCEKCGVIQ